MIAMYGITFIRGPSTLILLDFHAAIAIRGITGSAILHSEVCETFTQLRAHCAVLIIISTETTMAVTECTVLPVIALWSIDRVIAAFMCEGEYLVLVPPRSHCFVGRVKVGEWVPMPSVLFHHSEAALLCGHLTIFLVIQHAFWFWSQWPVPHNLRHGFDVGVGVECDVPTCRVFETLLLTCQQRISTVLDGRHLPLMIAESLVVHTSIWQFWWFKNVTVRSEFLLQTQTIIVVVRIALDAGMGRTVE